MFKYLLSAIVTMYFGIPVFGEVVDIIFNDFDRFQVVEEKIYFDVNMLTTLDDHMFLIIDGELLPIRSYECDDQGTFLRRDAIQAVRCPICKIYYDASWQSSICPHNNKMNR